MLFSLQNVCGPATVLQACNPRTDKKSVQNERNRKAGNPALPYGSLCDPQKALLGTFLQSEKSTIRSPASGSRNEAAPLPRGRKDYAFSVRKRRAVPFVLWQKEPKTQKREGESPFPFPSLPLWQQRISKPLGIRWNCRNCKTDRKQKEREQKSRDK